MIEQSIYGRADNPHMNANGQAIAAGYGYLAYSQGYGDIREYAETFINGYSNRTQDARGRLPSIMSMFELETPKGPLLILQTNTFVSSQGRDTHVAHQYAAGDEASILAMIREPLRWMQTPFQTEKSERIDYKVLQDKELKRFVQFNPGTLEEVLRYFSMNLSTFVRLLVGLFLVADDDKAAVIVLVDDSRPDYSDWIKRLIVHIYAFLPFSMRRHTGFETWFSGNLISGKIKLGFASAGNIESLGRTGRLNLGGEAYDVSDCIVFFGSNIGNCKEKYIRGFNDRANSYLQFTGRWIEAAIKYRDKCLQIEEGLNSFWTSFDTCNKRACAYTDFSQLIQFERLKNHNYTIRFETLKEDAGALYKGMGEEAGALMAELLSAQEQTLHSEAGWIDLLLDFLDEGEYGQAMAKCAAQLLRNTLMTLKLSIPRIALLIKMEQKGSIEPLAPDVKRSMFENALIGAQPWDDASGLISILCIDAGADRELKNLLGKRLLESVPSSFEPDAQPMDVLGQALDIDDAPLRDAFVCKYLENVNTGIEWLGANMERIVTRCIGAEPVRQRCAWAFERALQLTRPDANEAVGLITLVCAQLRMPYCEALCIRIVEALGSDAARTGAQVSRILSALDRVYCTYGMSNAIPEKAGSFLLEADAIDAQKKIALAVEHLSLFKGSERLRAFIDAQPRAEDVKALIEIIASLPEDSGLNENIEALLVRTFGQSELTPTNIPNKLWLLSELKNEGLADRCLRASLAHTQQIGSYEGAYWVISEVLIKIQTPSAALMDETLAMLSCAIQNTDLNMERVNLVIRACRTSAVPRAYGADLIAKALNKLPYKAEPALVESLLCALKAAGEDEYEKPVVSRLLQEVGRSEFNYAESEALINEYLGITHRCAAELINSAISRTTVRNDGEKAAALRLLIELSARLDDGELAQIDLDAFATLFRDTLPEWEQVEALCALYRRAGSQAPVFEHAVLDGLLSSAKSFTQAMELYEKYKPCWKLLSVEQLLTGATERADTLKKLNEIWLWCEASDAIPRVCAEKLTEKTGIIVCRVSLGETLSWLESDCPDGIRRALTERMEDEAALAGEILTADACAGYCKRVRALKQPLTHEDEVLKRLITRCAEAKCLDPFSTIDALLQLTEPGRHVDAAWSRTLEATLAVLISGVERADKDKLKEHYAGWMEALPANDIADDGAFSLALLKALIKLGVNDLTDVLEFFANLRNEAPGEEIRTCALELFKRTAANRAERLKQKKKLEYDRWLLLVEPLRSGMDRLETLAFGVCKLEGNYPGTLAAFLKSSLQEKKKTSFDVYALYCKFAEEIMTLSNAPAMQAVMAQALIDKLGELLYDFEVMYDLLSTDAEQAGLNGNIAEKWIGWVTSCVAELKRNNFGVEKLYMKYVVDPALLEAIEKHIGPAPYRKYLLWRIDNLRKNIFAAWKQPAFVGTLQKILDVKSASDSLAGFDKLLTQMKVSEKRKVQELACLCEDYLKLWHKQAKPNFPLIFYDGFWKYNWKELEPDKQIKVLCVYYYTCLYYNTVQEDFLKRREEFDKELIAALKDEVRSLSEMKAVYLHD